MVYGNITFHPHNNVILSHTGLGQLPGSHRIVFGVLLTAAHGNEWMKQAVNYPVHACQRRGAGSRLS